MLYPTLGVSKFPYKSFPGNLKHKRRIYNWIFQEVIDSGVIDTPELDTPAPWATVEVDPLKRQAQAFAWGEVKHKEKKISKTFQQTFLFKKKVFIPENQAKLTHFSFI